jgi:membrane-associated protein
MEPILAVFQAIYSLFTDLQGTLGLWINTYGTYIYAIFFCIIFVETGVVVWPFLPGDSLLFTAGAFAAIGKLDITFMFFLLAFAALLGDNCNYWIGHFIGPKVFKWKKSRFFNPEVLKKTHGFYEKYGGKAIILARFIPFVRTYAPFVAGVGAMTYRKFIGFCVTAAFLWVGVCLFAGYWLGTIPWVAAHFEVMILAIIFISVIPVGVEFLRHHLGKQAVAKAPKGRK